jgi:hypothetical protein
MAVFSRTAHMALIKLYSLMEITKGKVKVKLSLKQAVEAHRVVRRPTFSRQSAHRWQ